ncbi:LuxR family transcriptional regulator [uncultured Duncaniella sp.]|uniref:LuxR family transcriptional regulator n=1 Tax=uncultured Duncaniella sp. TaxID=2768039 RepID=UPI00260F15B1|nr:LuxR family transcriptional regulator [uncultured Duncaniella sp.]
MDRPLTNIEFFSYESEIWFCHNGVHIRLSETHAEIIDGIIELLSTFYPKAYRALSKHYEASSINKRYFRFRIVSRFIRCNFAQLDNVPDISTISGCTFEFVPCPLRGECALDNIVCRPEFDHKMSAAELPVMQLWYEGHPIEHIADVLNLSTPHYS